MNWLSVQPTIAHFMPVPALKTHFCRWHEGRHPDQVFYELANIFGWDIDFAQDIRQGDRFSLLYEEVYVDGERIGTGKILTARFYNQGRELTAVRYRPQRARRLLHAERAKHA